MTNCLYKEDSLSMTLQQNPISDMLVVQKFSQEYKV